ncbi:uncharacterized protein LODBEIA_P14840 [Lodderomyces beijingensis]|uniref:Kinesin-like protein n=1 Tax=Lodderomyces beijingensis TaxID=1775926 RepID=A0ABP0ZLU7_9ASCO
MSNIQVAVRCRGRNQQEIEAKSPVVLELANDNYSITEPYVLINHAATTATTSTNANANRSFTNSGAVADSFKRTYRFDETYGPQADQSSIYSNLARPLLMDFLNGSNVSILAYGQTGTGKTYTMCGPSDLKDLEATPLPETAGIIPRLLHDLFEELGTKSDDYTLKMSYLEIYNEELRDLLSQHPRKLRVVEKTMMKSTQTQKSISVQNLTERCVCSYQDSIKVLKAGTLRRKTAVTNMNDMSSRSHAIFAIQLCRSDSTSENSYTVSKMSLVDLAGSENISRSGSLVKEAGGINQSLLTLGRVINSLNEKKTNGSQHVPYRESKLTYILQDSLGGNTKTALIATISPAQINCMETCSTLDYAAKAKNVRNLPQNGHDSEVILKKTLVKNMAKEIAQLTQDLNATRNKNGIFLEKDHYLNIMQDQESLSTQLKEQQLEVSSLVAKCSRLNDEKHENASEIMRLSSGLDELRERLHATESQLQAATEAEKSQRLLADSLRQDLDKTKENFIHSRRQNSFAIGNYLAQFAELVKSKTSSFRIEAPDAKGTENLNMEEELLQKKVWQFKSKHCCSTGLVDFSDETVERIFTTMIGFQKSIYQIMEENLAKIQSSNVEFCNNLKNNSFADLEQRIRDKQNTTVKRDLETLKNTLKSSVDNYLNESISKLLAEMSATTHEEIKKERETLSTLVDPWMDKENRMTLHDAKENKEGKHSPRLQSSRRRALSLSPTKSRIPTIQRSQTNLLDDQNKRRKLIK